MKRRSTILLLFLFTAGGAKSQCSAPNFMSVVGYAQYHGAGAEIGYWPQDFKLGGFVGFGMKWLPVKEKGKVMTEPQSSVYLRAQLRLNRWVYLVGIAGAHQFDEGYVAGGLRLAIPIAGHDEGFRWAIIAEGTMGTEGPNVAIGIGYSLEK